MGKMLSLQLEIHDPQQEMRHMMSCPAEWQAIEACDDQGLASGGELGAELASSHPSPELLSWTVDFEGTRMHHPWSEGGASS